MGCLLPGGPAWPYGTRQPTPQTLAQPLLAVSTGSHPWEGPACTGLAVFTPGREEHTHAEPGAHSGPTRSQDATPRALGQGWAGQLRAVPHLLSAHSQPVLVLQGRVSTLFLQGPCSPLAAPVPQALSDPRTPSGSVGTAVPPRQSGPTEPSPCRALLWEPWDLEGVCEHSD